MISRTNIRLMLCFTVFCCLFCTTVASGSGKVGIYAIRMVPYGADAEKYTRPSWGAGLHAVFPLPVVSQLFAITCGLELVNFLEKEIDLREPVTGLRVQQKTSQDFIRLFVGGQIGGHGNGFLRPHAGISLALIHNQFTIDNVVPNDNDPNNPISQNVKDVSSTVFGYDLTLGLDLNFSNTVALDGGVKYVKSFSVPQQLGADAAKIYPQYFQIYLGVGVSFDIFKKAEDRLHE
ncbi:MAG: hypothetical protein KF749_01530 [Bacteroidetes bacterium]|nr:hypothetical protein [Bacteroidota bacterium]MCW5896195.1 hypothetical protein [Bacteroidota bacterium]